MRNLRMAWQKGPLPPDTYGWGGVVPAGEETVGGFYFADFCGDHVKIYPGERTIRHHQVAYYDNSLTLPPSATGRAGG
jgi:hypothetical protein